MAKMNVGTAVVIFAAFATFARGASKADCNFDRDFCGYTQDLHDQFDWTQINGSTPSSYTGPDAGTFAFIETSWPRLNAEAARLIGPDIQLSDGNCLTFTYHMKGLNVRQLNVYLQDVSGSRMLLWSVSGEQGDLWHAARVPLSLSNLKSSKIVFEGYSGTGYMGDIAIDNVKLTTASSCHLLPTSAKPTTPTSPPVPPVPSVPNCGVRPPASRIVGGNDAMHGEWPWQAMLMFQTPLGYKQFCGGALVHEDWVVTASHCINDIRPEDYKTHIISLGGHNKTGIMSVEQRIGIAKIYLHADYNLYPHQYNNDVALIRLAKPAIRTRYVQPVCLADGTVSFPPGTECWITGWGRLHSGGASPEILQQAKTKLLSYAECTKNGSYEAAAVSSTMLCAQVPGIDTCQGDSGGPLVCENNNKWTLVGVTSWGYGCAHPDYPGIYAKLTELKDWVFHHMATNP